MGIPYTLIAISVFILVGFYKIGDLDKKIGNPLGLAIGVAVLATSLIFPGGYLRIGLYVVGGIAFMTIYKMVCGTLGSKGRDQERDAEQRDASDDEGTAGGT